MEFFLKVLMSICVCALLFSFFGMYKSLQQAGVRSDRCHEIRGHRVSGKYNGSLCRVNGVIVDVDYADYRSQADYARGAK